ncbi:MAG: FkbM family methyltransferase [Patescibacteria group bacterium]|jgi:hypothetical protein
MLLNFTNSDLADGINLLDIGSSGGLDPKWKPIEKIINLTGFDANAEECKRMEQLPHPFRSARYLPYAITGQAGEAILYHTKSKFCFSLLEPNANWLNRFYYKDLFTVIDSSTINVKALSDIKELCGIDFDVMKIDTQGLELPILQQAESILEEIFYLEPETGFVENYKGESTFADVNNFLRKHNFLLFDFNDSHRIARDNVFQHHLTGKEQPLWTEAVYLKDYIALHKQNSPQIAQLTRTKALKVLLLCAVQGCYDYGYELAGLFQTLNLITSTEYQELSNTSAWQFHSALGDSGIKEMIKRMIAGTIEHLPKKARKIIYDVSVYTANKSRIL